MSFRSVNLDNMLDCPDEILTKIILHLNARDRMALAKTCTKLDSLILTDKKLFRDLDFSEEGYLTSQSDVQDYFLDYTKLKYIRKINVNNFYYETQVQSSEILQSIKKAQNIVELNITGFKFRDLKELGQFLEPLKKLEKLSADWPAGLEGLLPSHMHLRESFGRLTYLSMTITKPRSKWSLVDTLELCINLEELYLFQTYLSPESRRGHFWMRRLPILENLKRVVCCGCESRLFHTVIEDLLPNSEQWTKMFKDDPRQTEYLYFERNLDVAPELEQNVCYAYEMWFPVDWYGWYFRHERLMNEILVTLRDGIRNLCFSYPNTCFLTIEDAKSLLKDPSHQISYFHLDHAVDPGCDVQLVASAFPNIRKLVLTNIVEEGGSLCNRSANNQIGMKRKRADSEEQNERAAPPHPGFKKLVHKIPNLRDLTLHASMTRGSRVWDFSSLNLICGWKNLRSLYLAHLPISDGRFFVEIGKQCTNLEKLRFENLGSATICCYRKELLEMLPHCVNLKDFSLQQNNFPGSPELFLTLTGNTKLKRVRVQSLGRKRSVARIVPPVLKLASSCNLALLVCEIKGVTQAISNKLMVGLQKLKTDLNRPVFQFEIPIWHGARKPARNAYLELVHKDLLHSQHLSDALYRMGIS